MSQLTNDQIKQLLKLTDQQLDSLSDEELSKVHRLAYIAWEEQETKRRGLN